MTGAVEVPEDWYVVATDSDPVPGFVLAPTSVESRDDVGVVGLHLA